MKENYFSLFSKKHWILYLILISALIFPMLILVAIFTSFFKNWSIVNEFSAWSSLIAGVITYIGAAVLGIIVYYNSWLQQYREEKLDFYMEFEDFYNGEVKNLFSLSDFPTEEKNYYYEFAKDEFIDEERKYVFKRIIIKNFNKYPIKIVPLKVTLKPEKSNLIDCTADTGYVTNFSFRESIEYKEKSIILLGMNRDLFKKWGEDEGFDFFDVTVMFKVSNFKYSEYVSLSIYGESGMVELKLLDKDDLNQVDHSIHLIHSLNGRNFNEV